MARPVPHSAPKLPGYRIVDVLGKGAMATVYRALHEGLAKPVALKVLHPEVAADDEYRERFLREGKAAARFNHPNLVRAYEAGSHKGRYYLAMELVEGEDLSDHLERRGPLEAARALEVGLEVAKALEAAEANGMVHRDVKAENVLLGSGGQVKLTDLGLAKLQGDGSLTREGYTMGTVAYFSPEQCLGRKDVDVRSDLYSLGVLLHYALRGELPHGRGQNPATTMESILQDAPPALPEGTPPAARRAIARLMAKEREDRPQSGRAAVELLGEALEHLDDPEWAPAGGPSGSGERSPRRRRKRGRPRALRGTRSDSGLTGVFALGLLIVVALFLVLVLRSSGGEAYAGPALPREAR